LKTGEKKEKTRGRRGKRKKSGKTGGGVLSGRRKMGKD